MGNHGKVIYNVTGQTLEWYPPLMEVLLLGVPGAATFSVFSGFKSEDGTAEFSGTATLDPVSLSLASASGYAQTNRFRINLTPTGMAVGRSYAVTNAAGQREVVRVVALGSNYADVDEPLAYNYTLADTLVGLRQVISVPDSFAAIQANINILGVLGLDSLNSSSSSSQAPPYRAVLAYAIGTARRTALLTFDLVRHASKSGLSIKDLIGIIPDALAYEWSQQRGQMFVPQLEAAERDVQIDTRLAGYDPDQIQDPELWDRIVLQKWAVEIGKAQLFTQGSTPPWLSMVSQDYTNLFQSAIGTTCKAWVSPTPDGAVAINPVQQLFLRPR